MPDTFTKSERSRIMARVRGRGNASTELIVLRLLRANGLKGWRRHLPLVGTPDFTFPKAKVVLFVDGCFWHGCPRCYRAPKSSQAYWRGKIERNMHRDASVSRKLRRNGWQVIRVRECQLATPARFLNRLQACVSNI
ncbi:MAG TPA: very short patch repair endonuclease [bacterium]|nr:very short patch repair endonuclease [bacterium]